MPKIVDHNAVRANLLHGAIRVGSLYGIEGITNQMISKVTGIKESYIYRYYTDRDDLVRKAFMQCDANFFAELEKNISILKDEALKPADRLYKYAMTVWAYSVEDLDYCSFYTRFYYSPQFSGETRENHCALIKRFVESCSDFIAEDADREAFNLGIHLIFTSVLACVSDLKSGVAENTEENRRNTFAILYNIIKPYLIKD